MNYYLPVRLLCGEGVVMQNAEKIAAFGKRCLLVTGGSSAMRCGALADVKKALDSQGGAYWIYDRVQPNPSLDTVLEGGRLAAEKGCDFILGIGGGSPLDAAKAMAISAANPELDRDGLYAMDWPHDPLPVVLVGTTAGTGSEVTPVAVITDRNGRKRSFRGDKLYAALSFGDVRYTRSMPFAVTVSTAVDAFAHCLESWFSRKATPVSRSFALEGMRLLLGPLQGLARGEVPTEEMRTRLYDASILGGMAISVTGTNLGHNLGYYMTENHGLPHGFACALFLPALLNHAFCCVPEDAGELCRLLQTVKEELIALLRALVPDHGVRLSGEEIEKLLPRWENAPNIQAAVGQITKDDIRRILTEEIG